MLGRAAWAALFGVVAAIGCHEPNIPDGNLCPFGILFGESCLDLFVRRGATPVFTFNKRNAKDLAIDILAKQIVEPCLSMFPVAIGVINATENSPKSRCSILVESIPTDVGLCISDGRFRWEESYAASGVIVGNFDGLVASSLLEGQDFGSLDSARMRPSADTYPDIDGRDLTIIFHGEFQWHANAARSTPFSNFDTLIDRNIGIEPRPFVVFHDIQLAFDSPQRSSGNDQSNYSYEYKGLGVASYEAGPKDHIGVKFAFLILLTLIGYRALWFAIETEKTTNPMENAATLLAAIIALLAVCGAGKLLVEII